MVDAFGFRTSTNELIVCSATFVRIEFQFFDSLLQVRNRHSMAMDDNCFIMVNCLDVASIDASYSRFLCVFGLTNKKLAIHLVAVSANKEEEFKPELLDSREAVWTLDIRKGNGYSLNDKYYYF
jgi:hypothetical protein